MRRAAVVVILLLSLLPAALRAQPDQQHEPGTPKRSRGRNYQSRSFLIHTDLPPKEAQALLVRLETMMRFLSSYWGRPCRGVIECFVVDDLANWPPNVFPAEALAKIEAGEGVTITQRRSYGQQRLARSVVYASAKHDVPLHEAVHAYCGQTFGQTGPTWYAEGMAEMGKYWHAEGPGVRIPKEVLEYLKGTQPKPVRDIVSAMEKTGDGWENYAWRWALCHLLAHNPNYAARFRLLGLGFLTGQPVTFDQAFGPVANQIDFEYRFFLQHLEQGFRVDLCAWDWKKTFRPLKSPGRSLAVRVQARRGWQPTGLTATAGHAYSLTASGMWKISKDKPAVTADGDAEGRGRLWGVLMDAGELGEPFALGANGIWVAPAAGNLYVRCHEPWHELADNSGQISLKLRFATDSPPDGSPVFTPVEPAESKPSGAEAAAPDQPAEQPLRTWTDSTGRFQIEASMVSVEDGMVQLRKKDGKIVAVPLDRLSEQDRQFIRQHGRMP